MLTWGVIGALAVGVFGQRLVGMTLGRHARLGPCSTAVLAAVPVAIVCAVAAQLAFSTNSEIALDARVAGVAVALVCAWRRLPLYATVTLAAVVTALVRLVGG